MEAYPTIEGKMSLCLQSSMVAKEAAVQELGVGEDLTFSLFGWAGAEMRVIATLARELMSEEPERRLELVAVAATVLRKGWQCDSFSFVAEAFCSVDAEATKGKDLRAMFTKRNSPVFECLTVTHVERNEIMLVTQPYEILLGRKVSWLQTLVNEDARGLRDAKYPSILAKILEMEADGYESPDMEAFYDALAEGMAEDGFHLQWKFD